MNYTLAILFASSLISFAHATETVPTGIPARSKEQKKAHHKVEESQKKLKKRLLEDASPNEIGAAKAQVQKDRTEANKADAIEQTKEATPKN